MRVDPKSLVVNPKRKRDFSKMTKAKAWYIWHQRLETDHKITVRGNCVIDGSRMVQIAVYLDIKMIDVQEL